MPLLLYCVTLQAELRARSGGNLSKVRRLDDPAHQLRCYYSATPLFGGTADEAKEAAVAFYGVTQSIFRHVAIIPFRFPTLLADEAAISQELERNGSQYHAALVRLADVVQAEASMSMASADERPSSGAAYMRSLSARSQLMATSAETLREAVGPLAREWRQRDTNDGVRRYALVPRDQYSGFVEKARAARLPAGVECMLSGPWPATEFLDLKLETGAGSGF